MQCAEVQAQSALSGRTQMPQANNRLRKLQQHRLHCASQEHGCKQRGQRCVHGGGLRHGTRALSRGMVEVRFGPCISLALH